MERKMNFKQAHDDINKFLTYISHLDFIDSESEYFIPFYLENTYDNRSEPAFPRWNIKRGFYDYRCSGEGGFEEVSVITFLELLNDFEGFSKKEKVDKTSDTLHKFKCEVFRKIETYFDWNEEYSKFACGHNISLLDGLKNSIREKSLNEGVNASDYQERIGKLGGFIHNLKWAFQYKNSDSDTSSASENKAVEKKDENKKVIIRFWFHRSDFIINGTQEDEAFDINKELLLDAAFNYVKTPWLHHPWIDYWFLDALVYLELTSFRDELITGYLTGDNSFLADWYKSENTRQFSRNRDQALAGRSFVKFIGLFIVFPLITAFTYFSFSKILGFVVASLYVGTLVSQNEKDKGQSENFKEHLQIFSMLHSLYRLIGQYPIDLNHLKSVVTSYSTQTTGSIYSGICLDSIFHVVLKKAIRENPDGVLWLHSFDEDE
jgi:hypothetical protein